MDPQLQRLINLVLARMEQGEPTNTASAAITEAEWQRIPDILKRLLAARGLRELAHEQNARNSANQINERRRRLPAEVQRQLEPDMGLVRYAHEQMIQHGECVKACADDRAYVNCVRNFIRGGVDGMTREQINTIVRDTAHNRQYERERDAIKERCIGEHQYWRNKREVLAELERIAPRWEGADGRRKCTLDFTIKDARAIITHREAGIRGLRNDVEWATRYIAALEEHSVSTARKLPQAALENLYTATINLLGEPGRGRVRGRHREDDSLAEAGH